MGNHALQILTQRGTAGDWTFHHEPLACETLRAWEKLYKAGKLKYCFLMTRQIFYASFSPCPYLLTRLYGFYLRLVLN